MILFILSISIFGVLQTHGQCDFSLLKSEVSAFGTRRSYCDYQVKDGGRMATLKVLPGATFNTLDCHTCTCNQYGMRCCPTNKDPRSLRVPPYCRIVMDGCTPTVVRKTDNKTDCYTAQPVQIVRQQRKRMNKVLHTFNQIDRYQRQQRQKGGEPLEGNDIMMMLAMGGALDAYSPIGTMGGGGREVAAPFDLNTLMMFSMMGS